MSYSPSPVIIVGSFNQDLTYHCDDFPKPAETIVGKFVTGPGGKGSNQAVASARSGTETAFIGAVGKDAFADSVRKFYAEEGIQAVLTEYPDTPTGNAGILVSSSGENMIVVALGANLELKPQDIPQELIDQAEILVCQFEISPETTCDALQRAIKAQVTTVLNPAPMIEEFQAEYLRDVDILIPNEPEFASLMQTMFPDAYPSFSEEDLAALSDEKLHEMCRRLDVPTIIVTLGSRGCLISQEGGFEVIPALAGVNAIDTTGAGDAFVGGFSSGMVQFSGDIVQAARYGTVVAGLCVTKPGTAPSMPTQADINKHFNS